MLLVFDNVYPLRNMGEPTEARHTNLDQAASGAVLPMSSMS